MLCLQLSSVGPDWLSTHIVWVQQEPGKRRVPFNDVASAAKAAGTEYFVRINDDTEFITASWLTQGGEQWRHSTILCFACVHAGLSVDHRVVFGDL